MSHRSGKFAATAYRGAAGTRASANGNDVAYHARAVGGTPDGVICPDCGLTVRARADGTPRAHRIRTNGTRASGWPCPAGDRGTP